jgi:hypothetical protein
LPKEPNKPVAIVESEKTAIIASLCILNSFGWRPAQSNGSKPNGCKGSIIGKSFFTRTRTALNLGKHRV